MGSTPTLSTSVKPGNRIPYTKAERVVTPPALVLLLPAKGETWEVFVDIGNGLGRFATPLMLSVVVGLLLQTAKAAVSQS